MLKRLCDFITRVGEEEGVWEGLVVLQEVVEDSGELGRGGGKRDVERWAGGLSLDGLKLDDCRGCFVFFDANHEGSKEVTRGSLDLRAVKSDGTEFDGGGVNVEWWLWASVGRFDFLMDWDAYWSIFGKSYRLV